MNYTGLRRGDSDFDYVSAGDINRNGLIDAYDISVVATQLEDGIENPGTDRVAGTLSSPLRNRRTMPAKQSKSPSKATASKLSTL